MPTGGPEPWRPDDAALDGPTVVEGPPELLLLGTAAGRFPVALRISTLVARCTTPAVFGPAASVSDGASMGGGVDGVVDGVVGGTVGITVGDTGGAADGDAGVTADRAAATAAAIAMGEDAGAADPEALLVTGRACCFLRAMLLGRRPRMETRRIARKRARRGNGVKEGSGQQAGEAMRRGRE